MRKAVLLVVVSSLFVWMLGCASGKSLNNFTGGGGGGTSSFQSGNWAFTTSGGINNAIWMGGNLTGSGNTVTGNLFVVGDSGSGFNNITTSMGVNGTISSGTLTLSGAIDGSNIVLTFTGVPTSGSITTLSGTYTVTGGADTGDNGSVTGVIASSYTGTWQGTDTTTGAVVTVNFTEGATANSNGGYPVSATSGTGITFAGAAGCTLTGTLNTTNSFIAGGIVFLDFTVSDGDFSFLGVANDPTNPASLSGGGYTYTGATTCMLTPTAGNEVSFTFTKQ